MSRIFAFTGTIIIHFFHQIWKKLETILQSIGYTIFLLFDTLLWLRAVPFRFREILRQMYLVGAESLGVVLMVGAFSGMVLALQSGLTLRSFGAEELIAIITPLAMIRQMAPIMTCLILAGRVGSSMAAEIGTMAVSEELDALEVMSIDPVNYLVLPRFLAFSIMAPLLTFLAAIIGVLAAGIVGDYQIGLAFDTYWQKALEVVELEDIRAGLTKAFVFGVSIAVICCSEGLRTSGGAAGVGKSTRKSVVDSFVMVIVFNYFLTSILGK